MPDSKPRLRVALLAGTLSQGGAEKQLVYVARALSRAGVDVRVYTLTRGQFYESALQQMGLAPIWIGQSGNPLLRLFTLVRLLRRFRPHVIQSAQAFANLHVGLAGLLLNVPSIGALRSSLAHCQAGSGTWTRWLLSTPTALLINSQTAVEEVAQSKWVERSRLFLLPNAIDLDDYDNFSSAPCIDRSETMVPQGPQAIFVGRLIPLKRLDRFITALDMACKSEPALRGVIVGDGPEREPMQKLASGKGLYPNNITFLGQRDDVPILLQQATMLVLCSDSEGVPNVILEAMAMRLPVITTPAGDAATIVQDGVTGYVIAFDDVEAMAERMIRLARSCALRRQLGEAGRQRLEQHYSFENLADRLFSIYRAIAQGRNYNQILRVLPPPPGGSHGQL